MCCLTMVLPWRRGWWGRICLWRFLSLSGEKDRGQLALSSTSSPLCPASVFLLPYVLALSLASVDHLPGWFVLCPVPAASTPSQIPPPPLPSIHPSSGLWGWPDALASKHSHLRDPPSRSLNCQRCVTSWNCLVSSKQNLRCIFFF